MIYGNPNKLESAVVIQAGDEKSTLPRIKIKGADYYVINPTVPELVSEFKYGDMFDDPGVSYFASNFRLVKQDMDRIEKWMAEKGVRIEYGELPGKSIS